MKQKVYLETTIPSYLVADESTDILILSCQIITKKWWNERRNDYELFVSRTVLDEISVGDIKYAEKRLQKAKEATIIEHNNDIDKLVNLFMNELKLSDKLLFDVYHLSYTIFYQIDLLLTWNCKHLANMNMMKAFRKVSNFKSLFMPDICTPYELLELDTEV